MNWYLKVWKQYADFGGRARRRELWFFILFNYIAIFTIAFMSGFIGEFIGIGENFLNFIVGIYVLAVIIPALAVQVRRLHDTGKSGFWILIAFIPLGSIVLLIFYCIQSDPGTNAWGRSPLEEGIPEEIDINKFEEL